jgi:hypothetical protein
LFLDEAAQFLHLLLHDLQLVEQFSQARCACRFGNLSLGGGRGGRLSLGLVGWTRRRCACFGLTLCNGFFNRHRSECPLYAKQPSAGENGCSEQTAEKKVRGKSRALLRVTRRSFNHVRHVRFSV